MTDFSELLRKPAGEAKRPAALPIGDYKGTVISHEVDDNNRNKNAYIRLGVRLTDWPETFTSDEIPEGVDITKRQLRKDFFLMEEHLWRLDAFIRSCGINPEGRSYEDILPELIGQPVLVDVRHYRNPSDEVSNTVEKLVGLNGSK